MRSYARNVSSHAQKDVVRLILGLSAFDVVSVALYLPNLELYTILNIHRMGTIHWEHLLLRQFSTH